MINQHLKTETDQVRADNRTIEDLLARIARDGIHTSEKEPAGVSWQVIFDGLHFLQQPRAGADREEMN